MTACELLCQALGHDYRSGPARCFYCGGPCAEANRTDGHRVVTLPDGRTKKVPHVKSTFTDWAAVAAPQSDWVCDGCLVAMREDARDVPGREGRPQKMRNYTWLITETRAAALTKADRPAIRSACLDPPTPPFALCLAETGQKQVLYRTPVNAARDPVAAQLDELRVTYRTAELGERIRLAATLAPHVGVSRLGSPVAGAGMLRLADSLGDHRAAELLEQWEHVRGEPLSRLALFLTPASGDLDHE